MGIFKLSYFLLLILLSIVKLGLTLRTACDDGGEWVDEKSIRRHPFSHIYVYPHINENITQTFDEHLEKSRLWSQYACDAESKYYNCQWHGIEKERDIRLQKRVLKSKNKNCLEFYAFDFLDVIRGRQVLFVGDSVMSQVYSALVCESYQLSESKIIQEWLILLL